MSDSATPSSFRSSAVRFGRTVSSISFSRNAASYFSEAQAPQPDHNVHEGAHIRWVAHIIFWGAKGVQCGVGVLRASQSPLGSNRNGRSLTPF